MRNIGSINRVFWLLIGCSFALALATSAAAVWITSKPFLVETQRQAVLSQAQRVAARVDAILDPSESLTGFLSSEPTLVSYIVGYVMSDDGFVDRIENTTLPDDISEFLIFDFSGTPLSFHVVGQHSQSLDTMQAARSLSLEVLTTNEMMTRVVQSHVGKIPDEQTILIAAPILHRGFAEGVLVTVVDVPLKNTPKADGMVTLGKRIVQSPDVAHLNTGDDNAILVPIGSTGLSLLFTSESNLFKAIGQEMVTKAILAVSAALLLPFGVFGWLGKQTILRPHAEVQRSRNKLREQQKELSELAAIARKAEEAILITDLDTNIVWHNPAFERISGYTAGQIKGQTPSTLLQGANTDPKARAKIRAALISHTPVTVELINYRNVTEEYWVRLSISTLFDDLGKPYGYMAISSDISDRKRDEANLLATTSAMEWQALHDELTGLPNRRCFNVTFEEHCRAEEQTSALAIIRIDLDHFKNVNDTMGHEAGDLVLCEVARILRDVTAGKNVPVRIGGDEFIVLLVDDGSLQVAQDLAETILHKVSQPIEYEGKIIRVGASFGIASSECMLVERRELVRAADAALYLAKERGRNQVVAYGTDEHRKVIGVRDTAEQIRCGIERGEFEPFYQPQVDAQSREIVGVEVLARWVHPDRGVLLPSSFLRVADQLSMLGTLDKMIMEKALQDVSTLEERGVHLPKISFNVTASRLSDPDLLVAIDKREFRKTAVSFEILESVFLDDQPEFLDFTLDLLREKGLSIEIDDFGSGHASMISLMRVRPDVLKIDQRLVMGAPDSRVCQNMVRSIIGIAESLEIKVTAEGVETRQHADMMQRMGCTILQGFHFSEALPFDDLHSFLTTHQGGLRNTG
ncbi:putative bifunctional diguanylate cyclase/phosphodiesterase [Roseobacter sp. MH60115]|uniref:putative bifunctional diguanylate cyclase/phosphodiesterase n=1 Tax=Roseobacter sp. MH60115 TaxID=2785324 RepID=UPI0018A32508|nr:EAL domain-containing protein [Roseobacter sp. MH60115]